MPLVIVWVLVVAVIVRCVSLDVPSMWWDEILVPMTARYSLEYIFEWARHLEVNSPYFVVLLKGLLEFGDSDFALRLWSVIGGSLGVYVIYRVGTKFFGDRAGILAATIIAICPLHVLLSRQVRPYGLFLLLLALSLERVSRIAASPNGQVRNCLVLAVINAGLFCLHYMAAPVFLAESVFLALLLMRRDRPVVASIVIFAVSLGLSFAPVAPFFLGTFLSHKGMLFAGPSFLEVLEKLLSALGQMVLAFVSLQPLDYVMPPTPLAIAVGIGLLVFCVAACFVLFTKNPRISVLLLVVMLVPLAFFILTRQGFFRPRHLSFLLVPAILLCSGLMAQYLDRVCKSLFVCIVIFLSAAGVFQIWNLRAALYEEQSYPDIYKTHARQLAGILRAEIPVMGGAIGDCNAIVWYLDRFMDRNPMRWQSWDAGDVVHLDFVTPHLFGAGQNEYEKEMLAAMGKPERVQRLDRLLVSTYEFGHMRNQLPEQARVALYSAKPWLFYKQASYGRNVAVEWTNTPLVHPTLNAEPCSFAYDVFPVGRQDGGLIEGHVGFVNSGSGNSFKLLAAFDDGAPMTVVLSDKVEGESTRRFKIVRRGAFDKLRLTCEMQCDIRTPSYPGANLDTVGFHQMELTNTPLRDVAFGSLSVSEATAGLNPPEATAEGLFRWGLSPGTTMSFQAAQESPMTLAYRFSNPIPGQTVMVEVNGQILRTYSDLQPHRWLQDGIDDVLPFKSVTGNNTIVFHYLKGNGSCQDCTFAPQDSRPLAVAFTTLRLEIAGTVDGGDMVFSSAPLPLNK